jgi:predicted nucleic acid-binding protein
LTLDTGALIALERPGTERARFVTRLIADRLTRCHRVTLPTVVLAEWWRGEPKARLPKYSPLHAVNIEPLDDRIAKLAGWALGKAGKGPSIADAIVVVSAAQRGDVVLTSDIDDLTRVAALFTQSVRLLRI